MTAKEAAKKLANVGAANATGNVLALCYAELVANTHGGKVDLYYSHLRLLKDDAAISKETKVLLTDRQLAWDVLIGLRAA